MEEDNIEKNEDELEPSLEQDDSDTDKVEGDEQDKDEPITEEVAVLADSAVEPRPSFEARFEEGVGHLKPRDLTFEMETSYLDYAMSVIVSRALPDVRDGLKPVHRRVLFAMHDTGLNHTAKYRKSAKVVGEVIGNYHPHGDIAVYDTLVRMAQDFSMRYQLVDGQGNFGSMDGDSAAAMRYTECRMSAIAGEMVADIEKETVPWQDNYDGSTKEPCVMPARVPQLLLNGAMGIAVGMATNIPPHNLRELCDGIIYLIDHPEAEVDDLMKYIKGPDFPTGGSIYNLEDIKMAYATGKGRILMRAKAEIEEAKRGFRIVITEIPYQVNKATMIEKIADLVKNKRLDGISDLRDESDRHGIRVVVELKSNSYPKKVLNRLFELTAMQTAFHVNMLALTPDLEPRVMTLKDVLEFYIIHRQEVIEKRSRYELRKAQERAHILEGLKIALDNIDEVIKTIRASANRDEASRNLVSKFGLSVLQAGAILDMRLSQLAALERKKIEDEYAEVLKTIAYLEDLLAHPEKILGLIKDDLRDVAKKYGDDRRTAIVGEPLGEFRIEDLIPDEQVIVALTRGNYIKRQDVSTYRKQTRGGVGVVGITTKEEDIVDHLVCSNTHDNIYFFTDKGRVFKSRVYEIPSTSRLSKGTPIVNVIQLAQREKVTAVLTTPKGKSDYKYFIMGTVRGQIKKTEISQYENIRKTGIIAIGLKGDDELKWVRTSTGADVIVEVSEKGQAILYPESDARPMGRSASGVTGMRLKGEDKVMAMAVIAEKYFAADCPKDQAADMLVVLENGFGKRTKTSLFHLQKRGGYGMRAASCTSKTGNVIGMHITYSEEGDIVIASRNGQFIRLAVANIKKLGRDTQGVTLMRLKTSDKVSTVAFIVNINDDEDTKENGSFEFNDDDPGEDSGVENKEENTKEEQAVPDVKLAKIVKEKPATRTKPEPKSTVDKVVINTYKKSEDAADIVSGSEKKNGQDIEISSDTEPSIKNETLADDNEKSVLPPTNLHIQSYNKNVIIEKEDISKPEVIQKMKNPTMQKDETNYWGKPKK